MTRTVLSAWTCGLLLALCVSDFRHFSSAQELEGFEDEVEDALEVEIGQGGGEASSMGSGGAQEGGTESMWDEDEFEGLPVNKADGKESEKAGQRATGEQRPRQKRSIFKRQEHYYYEMLAGAMLVLYAVNVFIGKQRNEAIALAWARNFVSEGAVFEKNFSLLGVGDADDGEVLLKESQSIFKFYASGRRFCDGMLATLDLRARQDFLSMLLYLVSPREDKLEIEVYMQPLGMPSTVLACATQKLIRTLVKDNNDLKTYTKQIPVKQISDWPGNKLAVHTESAEVFYDLFTPEIRALFTGAELETTIKYFRTMHFTSEYQGSTHQKVLRFSFALPAYHHMEDLGKLMSMVPLFIDVVGAYKLSPEAKKRADKSRADELERLWKEGADSRREALQQKKRDEYEAEMERIKKLPPADQAKWVEKQQRVKQRRAVKVKMVRA